MDFYEVLEKVIELLQRHGRVTYRALKLQFKLDDQTLAILKDELLFGHPVADQEGRGLVWTGAPVVPVSNTEDERHVQALLPAVILLLQHDRRVTYDTFKYVFGISDALLEKIQHELILRQLTIDESGDVLTWTGGMQTVPATALPDSPQISAVTPPVIPERVPPTAEVVTPYDRTELARFAPDAERRQLTVMFCDLADSTKLSGQLDPEDLRDVIRAYQETAAEVIQQYAGHIAQYLGDGILVYFGWPQAHEDDAHRAVHVSQGIVDAVTTNLNPRLGVEKGVRLTVRIGIHTGPVVVGEMGGGGRHENLATGETVNIAARLEGLAAPDTVMISNVTARLVRDAFVLEDLGLHELKGVAEPMPVFRVLGPIEAYEDETVVAGVPFLVGRDEEMGLLLRCWEQAKESLGQAVLISGTAGIGKSSLVETLRAHVRDERLPRIAFRCSSYYRNSALHPVIAHVERLLNFDRDDTPVVKLDKLEQGLQSYSLSIEEVMPLFAALLTVPLDDRYPSPALTSQQQKQQTLDALVAWMLEEGERQPVLVVWEDLQWADPSMLEMLGLVLDQTPTVPMLHVLTFRPEFELPWPTRSHMMPITLNRLERPQVEAFITHLADDKVLPVEVVEHIVAKTDGVPLYVEELTKMLLASDLLREESDHYVLTGPLLTIAIPDTLQDSLMARLDQLNAAKEVAQLGAVIGREFPYELIQAISTQDEEVLQAGLRQLVDAELLYQRGRPPRARYIFKHVLIQDVAYQSLLKSTQQQYHQQIAQLLEARFPETVATRPELLAHHYTEAGCTQRAVVYWQRAGQRASERSAHVEAITHITNGLEVLATLPEMPERIQHELALHIALGASLTATKGYGAPEVEHAYTRARVLCQQVGDSPQLIPVLFGLWRFYLQRADLQTARELGEQCLTLAQHGNDPARLLRAHTALGVTLFYLGELSPAMIHLEQGGALYDPQKHRSRPFVQAPGVTCLSYAARVLWYLGYPNQALEKNDKALTLAQELSHPFSLAAALSWTAILHQFRREEQVTQERAESAIALATKQGFSLWVATGTILGGWALAAQDQGKEGIAQMHQGLAAYRATEGVAMAPYFLALLAGAYGNMGQVEEAVAILTEALTEADNNAERFYEAELYRFKGELLLTLAPENQTEAETCLHQAIDIARSQQAKSLELRAATSLARLWQSQGKRREAYDLLEPVYGWFTEGFDTADLKDAKALLEELG